MVNDQEIPRLKDVLNVGVLQKMQDNFSEALGIALVVVDEKGKPLTTPSGFSDFCLEIRSDKDRLLTCCLCDNAGGRKAMEAGEPVVYRCQYGLVEYASPIMVEGFYLGAVVAGQVRIEPDQETKLEFAVPLNTEWQDDPLLTELYQKIGEVSFKKFESATRSLFHMANSLAEQGYSNITQKKLYQQNIKLAEESKRRVELEKSLQEAELQALSYQVNPHFLFNVLNTVGRLALFENASKTEEMIYGFSDMLRYILKKGENNLITLKSEIQHVENYLHLQQVRMGEKFSYHIDIPEYYLKVICPFMVLQPIVENIFNYVVELKEDHTEIKIRAHDDGQDVFVTIADNGNGMPKERIANALNGTLQRQNKSGLGIFNVNHRLALFFGETYGLSIESDNQPNRGMSVIIRCPLEYMFEKRV